MGVGRPKKHKDINIGDIFNDMTVTKYIGKYKTGNDIYELTCNICGRVKQTIDQDIYKGKSLTHKYSCMNRKVHDTINIDDLIGDMKIIKYIGRQEKSGNKIFLVKCMKCDVEKCMSDSNINKKVGIYHGSGCKRIHKMYTLQSNESFKKHIEYIHSHKRMYRIWMAIIQRITNPNNSEYYRYGGRGIKNEFDNFEQFVDLMGPSYYDHVKKYGEKNTTIDRKDNNGNYSYDNCRWATYNIQVNNKSHYIKFKAISPNGEEYIGKSIKTFANNHDLKSYEIYKCLINESSEYDGWKFISI